MCFPLLSCLRDLDTKDLNLNEPAAFEFLLLKNPTNIMGKESQMWKSFEEQKMSQKQYKQSQERKLEYLGHIARSKRGILLQVYYKENFRKVKCGRRNVSWVGNSKDGFGAATYNFSEHWPRNPHSPRFWHSIEDKTRRI